MNWDEKWTLALIPVLAPIAVSVVLVVAGQSAATAQWAAIVTFFVTLPFCIARLLDRA